MSQPQKRSAAARLAPMAPLGVVLPCGGIVLAASAEHGDAAALGPVVLVTLASAIGAITISVLLALLPRGRAIPGALFVVIAAAPWAISSMVGRATALSDPSDVALGHVETIAQTITSLFLGSAAGAALLGGTAIGLALAAWAERGPDRNWKGAAIGGAAGLLLAGVASAAALTSTTSGLGAVLASLAALVALVMAGASSGTDRRSSALAASAGAAASLAVIAAAGVGDALVRIEIFGALAFAAPHDRALIYAAGLEDGRALTLLAAWGWIAAIIAASLLAAWCVARAGLDRGRAIGAVIIVAAAALAIVPGAGVLARVDAIANAVAEPPARWQGVELAHVERRGAPIEPMLELVVTRSEILVDERAIEDTRPSLRDHADRLRFIAERAPNRPFEGTLLIAADRRARYTVVAQAITDASSAGFFRAHLVMDDERGEPAAFAIEAPAQAPPEDARVRVTVSPSGYFVEVAERAVGPDGRSNVDPEEPSVPARDLSGLARCIAGIEAAEGAPESSLLLAGGDVTWDDVAPVAAIVSARFPMMSFGPL